MNDNMPPLPTPQKPEMTKVKACNIRLTFVAVDDDQALAVKKQVSALVGDIESANVMLQIAEQMVPA